MSGALSPEHPDDDFLADLAADVLPTHQARAVEAHVMDCPRCTCLLTDAEQMRNLLLTDVPGPMPADVLARIEQALQIEVTARDAKGDGPDPTAAVRVISPWEDTTTIEALEVVRKRQTSSRRNSRTAEAGTAGTAGTTGTAYAAGDPPTTGGIAAPRTRGPRLARSSRGPSRSRRDLRQEVHDVKVGRRGTVLAAAAGTVVLIGLGGFVVVGLFTDREAEPVYSSASSLEAAPKAPAGGAGNGPPVLMTGTNYSKGTLAQQAKVLVSQVSRVPGQQRSALSAAGGKEPGGSGTAGTGTDAGTGAGTDAGNQSLRDTATLNGCLAALRAGGRRPVAVDLARYDGRDAAIIVLNGANGGYEVWAVARDCHPGVDGTITYLDLTQQPAATRTG